MKWIKSFLLFSLITFFLLELSLVLFTKVSSPKIELPTYSFENTQSFWYDLNADFGTWHLPNHSYRQKKSCFDVTYKSNKHGFRDRERPYKSNKKRVHVIGDSFIEGVGVQQGNRLSNLLEDETQTPHLNFGLAGNFGPTQYVKLYETMASRFEHDAILVGILPANDFIDDDYEINQKIGSNRYKPYWVGNFPDYQLVYFQDSLHKSSVNQQDLKTFKRLLKNFSYSYNYLIYFKTLMRQRLSSENPILSKADVPSYFNFSEEQLNRLKYALLQLKKLAPEKKLMVFTIPTAEETIEYKWNNNNPLGFQLSSFCEENQIPFLDLIEASSRLKEEEIESLFLDCDGHWSNKGNLFAKQQIQAHFNFYQ